MHQAMAHHFILALETFPAYASWTTIYGTEMRSVLGMHVGMGASVPYVRAGISAMRCYTYLRRYWVWKGAAVHPGCVHL
jgi:hypothetical protein